MSVSAHVSSRSQSASAIEASAGARASEFDGLRGIAIAMVLWHHLIEVFLPSVHDSWLGWLRAGTNLSWSGVDLFFVLSGFFIGGILIDRRNSPRLARIFYLRRAARILPLYYLTLGCLLVLQAGGVPDSFRLFPAWVYGLFLTNFSLAAAQTWDWLPLSVLWSLAVEEQFYLLAPWVARLLSPNWIPWFALGMALTAAAARILLLLWYPNGHFAAQVLMPLRMDGLALGVLVAWAVRAAAAREFFRNLAKWWPLTLGLGLAGLGLLTLQRPVDGDRVLCLYGYSILAVFFALIVAVVAGVKPAGLCRVLSFQPLARLGRLSYFVYLWHAVIALAIIRWFRGPNFVLASFADFAVVVVAFAATWACAVVSWRFLEGPIVAWSHRQAY